MTASRYFANLLMPAPPGIAPLRVPYAPFGASRSLLADAAPPHAAFEAVDDDAGDVRRDSTRRDTRQCKADTPRDPLIVAAPVQPPVSQHAKAANGERPDGGQANAAADASFALASRESAPHDEAAPVATATAKTTLAASAPVAPVQFTPRTSSARDWQVVPVARQAPASSRPATAAPAQSAPPVAMPDGERVDPAPAATGSGETAPRAWRETAAGGQPPRAEAPSAPSSIEIEHIEVRLLPPAPLAKPQPARQASGASGPLLRLAPPFGLRQS